MIMAAVRRGAVYTDTDLPGEGDWWQLPNPMPCIKCKEAYDLFVASKFENDVRQSGVPHFPLIKDAILAEHDSGHLTGQFNSDGVKIWKRIDPEW